MLDSSDLALFTAELFGAYIIGWGSGFLIYVVRDFLGKI